MKIVLIGVTSSSKNISGQSICFDMLLEQLKKDSVSYKLLNVDIESKSNIIKAINYLKVGARLIVFYLREFKVSKLIYIAIAQSFLGFFRDFLFIWISFFFRKKIIVHLHGGNFKDFYLAQNSFFRFIIRKTYDQCDVIIVLSNIYIDLFDFLKNYKKKVRVVENGIPEMFYNIEDKVYDKKSPNILYLSNLIESKGYLDVLRCIPLLKNKFGMNPILYFCGNFLSNSDDVTFKSIEDAKEYFFNYIKENNLEKNVFYKGLIKGNEKTEMLEKANFMVLPTNYNAEGQPISIIEGLSKGCVLITTDYRDIKYMNITEETGFHVSYNNPEAIASCIAKVDEERFLIISRNSINQFKNKYSFEKHYNSLINIFYEFISK